MPDVTLTELELKKLVGAKSGDACLLYLGQKAGLEPEDLGLTGTRLENAAAFLRQSGLWEPPAPRGLLGEPPTYTEQDVELALKEPDRSFRELVEETQRRFGRVLSNEEVKILLSIRNYLGLSNEVISILLSFCIDRNRNRGAGRMPSFRAIEKEALRWADQGIDTVEEAAAYVQLQTYRRSLMGRISQRMGLSGRKLSNPEEKYLGEWITAGFGEDAVILAYEKTCLQTGTLNWKYMDSILKSWEKQGLFTPEQIKAGDAKPAAKKGKNADFQQHGQPLSPALQRAAEQMLNKKEN